MSDWSDIHAYRDAIDPNCVIGACSMNNCLYPSCCWALRSFQDAREVRQFTHPDFGREIRVEVFGKEVRLTFVSNSHSAAETMAEYLVDELRRGTVNLTVMGELTSVIEE